MSTELALHQTEMSGLLGPSRINEVFIGIVPRARVQGAGLRLAVDLSLDDEACAGFILDFMGQGRRLRGAANGPSGALLCWTFHTIGATLGADLTDLTTNQRIDANPGRFEQAAFAYLATYEAYVKASREGGSEFSGAAFLAWLAREEHIAPGDHIDQLAASLSLDDPATLYETLLESDAIDDIFVSEREVLSLLARFRAILERATERRRD
jgi:hypothetical protein